MQHVHWFSPDYATARQRFRAAVGACGFVPESHAIGLRGPAGEDLTIDVAVLDAAGAGQATPARTLVLTSGLHGVEGFLGSAIQVALLSQGGLLKAALRQTRLVLVHALNPYGFAWRRRWNEDGVDLNRNFLLPGQRYEGSPPLYPEITPLLNPDRPPSRLERFPLRLLRPLVVHGFAALKRTIPIGQYDFPKGLYFGGKGPARTHRLLRQHLPRWIGPARQVTHLDVHTGLGEWGTCTLLVEGRTADQSLPDLAERFAGHEVARDDSEDGISFPARGGLGPWCEQLMPESRYDFLTAEFGTCSNLSIVEALHDENRAHWWGRPEEDYDWTKRRLVEHFAPADRRWRERCVEQGLQLVAKAVVAG